MGLCTINTEGSDTILACPDETTFGHVSINIIMNNNKFTNSII